MHYRERRTHFGELAEDVRTDKDGGSVLRQVLQSVAEPAPGKGVETTGGLVEYEDPRTVEEGFSEDEALGFASRKGTAPGGAFVR